MQQNKTPVNSWSNYLSKDEKIVFSFGIGERYLQSQLVGWCLVGLILLPIYGLGLLFILSALFYYRIYYKNSFKYALTDKRILAQVGWLSTTTMSIDYQKITHMSVVQAYFEKALTNTGTIFIDTAGGSSTELVLMHIDNPFQIKQKIESLS